MSKLKSLFCIHLGIDNFEIENFTICYADKKGNLVNLEEFDDDLPKYFESIGNPKYVELVAQANGETYDLKTYEYSAEDTERILKEFEQIVSINESAIQRAKELEAENVNLKDKIRSLTEEISQLKGKSGE